MGCEPRGWHSMGGIQSDIRVLFLMCHLSGRLGFSWFSSGALGDLITCFQVMPLIFKGRPGEGGVPSPVQ